MLLRDREWEDCTECGRHKTLIREEEFGCDHRGKVVTGNTLTVDVFNQNHDTERHEYCSWLCVLKATKKLKSDYFINLPMLHFDEKTKGQRAKDFWSAIKELGKKTPTR